IDDDEEEYLITRSLLARANPGYRLDWASTYGEGLAAVMRGEHDAYLVDYRLGVFTGVELVQAARKSGSRAPLVMLTGSGNRETDSAALEAGASDYLVKGRSDPALIDRTLRYAISHKLAL